MRARRLTVAGIYQTNFSAYDDLFLITDLYTVNRLNSWQKGQVSGIELEVNEYSRLESVKEEIRARVDTQVDAYGGTYYTQSVEEVNPQIFAWLDLLDVKDVLESYCIVGFPHIILVDPEGKIVAKELRGDDLYNTVEKFVNGAK